MSFQDIAEQIVEAKKNAKEWLHLIQTSTNNISTKSDYQCALNGYLAGFAKANEKLQSECERLKAENEKAKEQGAREMVQIVVEFWTKHQCDPDAPILSVKQTEEKCMQLWEERRKGREKK